MRQLLFPVLGMSCLMLTGCVDNAYDLDDIDTTSEIKVNNLVIPVNIDDVNLDNIISLDEDGKVKIIDMNGERFYALDQTGNFNSDPIHIDKVTAKAPKLDPTFQTVYMSDANSKAMRAPAGAKTYFFGDMKNPFTFTANAVDKAIRRLDSAEIDNLTFAITLSAQGVEGKISQAVFENVSMELPKGLTVASVSVGKYDPATGIWTIPEITAQNGKASLTLVATAVDFAANGAKLDADTRVFSFTGAFNVNEGTVALVPSAGLDPTQLPQKFDVRVDYTLGDLTVNSISGEINYQIEGVKINPIWLTNIPEFFLGNGTNVFLANPQIYLSLNNPVADDNLEYRTGITITAVRPAENNVPDLSFSLNNPYFTVGSQYGVNGPYNYVLSPLSTPLNTPVGYGENLKHETFTSLSNVVGVDAQYSDRADFPEKLLVDLDNPEIPTQTVKNFKLGRTIAGVNGNYEFVAPLAFKEGSVVVYADEKTGWDDEFVQELVIDTFTLTAEADSNLPVSAEVTVYPLDTTGKKIQGVSLQSSTLQPNAYGQNFEVTLTGTIKNLDGLAFEAIIKPGNSAEPLRPDQTIKLRNVKVKVNGSYIKEL